MAVAGDFVHFVKPGPREVDQGLAVAEVEAGLERAEGDFSVTIGSDGDRGGLDQVEMAAIPQIGPASRATSAVR
jgi:hypothetical protein